jgi:Cof subfamily protein (haloacid dehalogenase superfamily)
MYKMLVLDIDDTLVDDNKNLPAPVAAAVRQAHEKGVMVILCTGRAYSSSKKYMDELGLEGYIINYGGAQVTEHPSGKIIESIFLEPGLANQIINYAKALGVYIQTYLNEEFFHGDDKSPWPKYYHDLIGVVGHYDPDFEKKDWSETIKLLAITDPDKVSYYLDKFSGHFGDKVRFTSSIRSFIEVNSPLASKGNALKKLCEKLGIDRKEVIAVGDNTIDASMLEYAGLGVCVENGTPDAKASADIICPSNEDGGVKWVIDQYIL